MENIIFKTEKYEMTAILQKNNTNKNKDSFLYLNEEEKFVTKVLLENENKNLDKINTVIKGPEIEPKLFLLSTYAPDFSYKNDLYLFERKNGEIKIYYKDNLFFRTGKEYSDDEMKILNFNEIFEMFPFLEKIFPIISENSNYILEIENKSNRITIIQTDKKTNKKVFLHFNEAFKIEENSDFVNIHLNKFIEKPIKKDITEEKFNSKLLKIIEGSKKILINKNGTLDFSFEKTNFTLNLNDGSINEKNLNELIEFLEKATCTFSSKLLEKILKKLKSEYKKRFGISDEINRRIQILQNEYF